MRPLLAEFSLHSLYISLFFLHFCPELFFKLPLCASVEQWFHCFTSPYWSGLLIIVFQVTRDIFSKSCWDTGLSKLILQNVLFYHCNTYNESGELALHQIFIFMNAWYREKYILSPGTLSLSCPFSADKSNWSCRMIINRANLWSLGIIF